MKRLIVCIDVDAETLPEAYGIVYHALNGLPIEWESSDEWFDDDGELGDPEALQAARMAFFAKGGDKEVPR